MAAISLLTGTPVEPLEIFDAEIQPFIAGVAITKGQAVYLLAAGTVGLADANDAGKEQFRGIALNSAGVGQAVDVLKRGLIAGFDVQALNADAIAYLSDVAGELETAAGTLTVNVGRVVALTDKTPTKVLYIEADWLRTWV